MSRVYIGRLSDSARDRDVERFFKGYGRIREILLKNGYGFVEFEDHRDADDAVYDLNGKVLCGERVIVEHAKSPGSRTAAQFERRNNSDRFGPPLRTQYRVVIENLSSRTTWQDLKDYLGKVGEVTFVEVHKDRSGEGVAEFATLGDMKNAVTKLNGSDLLGRRIKLREDRGGRGRASSPRRRSRSRSRSRDKRSRSPRRRPSRSRTRSRSPRRQASKRRSRSRSAQRSRTPQRSRSPQRRSGSRSPPRRSRSASRDGFNSRSPQRRQSRSVSHSPHSSASRSPSPHRNGHSSNHSRSRSRS